MADWLIKFVQANFQAGRKPYGGGTDRPWRDGIREWGVQFSGEYGAIWGSLEVAEKSHMGVPIGNSARHARARAAIIPHFYPLVNWHFGKIFARFFVQLFSWQIA